MAYVPDRGEVIWLEFNPQSGHEQAGHRPALVISPKIYNSKTSLALVCPITSQVKNYGFEVAIPSGFTISGVVLADQIKNLDWNARNAKYVCTLPNDTVADVIEKIKTLLV